MYSRFFKRCFDLAASVFILFIFLPVLAVLSLLVAVKLGTPVLFRQQRPGIKGRVFTIYKFRTMTNACSADGALRSDAERLTPFGRFMRSASLDELPELWNVITGDMSLVGPRPLMVRYIDRYTPEQARRHDVRPGITGWAQINGRNAISWEDKFRMDVWYVDHCSFWLDMKILFLTVWKVVRREGISAKGEATMTEFMGSETRSAASSAADPQHAR